MSQSAVGSRNGRRESVGGKDDPTRPPTGSANSGFVWMRTDDDPVKTIRSAGPALVAVVVVLVGVVIVAASLSHFLSNLFSSQSCSRSGQRALACAEEFVRGHLSDASGFEVQTYDCDSGDSAFLRFRTGLSPTAAREICRHDPTCRQVNQDDEEGEDVDCSSGSQALHVYIERFEGATRAELVRRPEPTSRRSLKYRHLLVERSSRAAVGDHPGIR